MTLSLLLHHQCIINRKKSTNEAQLLRHLHNGYNLRGQVWNLWCNCIRYCIIAKHNQATIIAVTLNGFERISLVSVFLQFLQVTVSKILQTMLDV